MSNDVCDQVKNGGTCMSSYPEYIKKVILRTYTYKLKQNLGV